jgi:hypothetical protein
VDRARLVRLLRKILSELEREEDTPTSSAPKEEADVDELASVALHRAGVYLAIEPKRTRRKVRP